MSKKKAKDNPEKVDPRDKQIFIADVTRRLKVVRAFYELVRGIDQTKFAKRLDISQPRFANYESGRTVIPPEIAARLWKPFSITTDYLYRGEPGDIPGPLWQEIQEFAAAQLEKNPLFPNDAPKTTGQNGKRKRQRATPTGSLKK